MIRPADVYGPGCRPWVLEPLAALRSNRFLLPARGRGLFTPIYIDDLVEGGRRPRRCPSGRRRPDLHLGGESPVTTLEYSGASRGVGRPEPPRNAPTAVAVTAAEAARLVAGREAAPHRAGARCDADARQARGVSNEHAHRMLGWWPQVGLDEGMGRVEAWLREEGLLDADGRAR